MTANRAGEVLPDLPCFIEYIFKKANRYREIDKN